MTPLLPTPRTMDDREKRTTHAVRKILRDRIAKALAIGDPELAEWLAIGINHGWCGPPVCETHDGTPTSSVEDDEFDEGQDPCIHILRLYSDDKTRAAVEANHSPSQWRKTGLAK